MASPCSCTAVVACTLLVLLLAGMSLSSGGGAAAQPLSGDFEDDKVHEFLRVLDQAARYRRECFGECAKGCYCTDNPYSCLRECMPTPPTRRCGATYGAVQGVFSSSATFTATAARTEMAEDGAGSGGGGFSGAT